MRVCHMRINKESTVEERFMLSYFASLINLSYDGISAQFWIKGIQFISSLSIFLTCLWIFHSTAYSTGWCFD